MYSSACTRATDSQKQSCRAMLLSLARHLMSSLLDPSLGAVHLSLSYISPSALKDDSSVTLSSKLLRWVGRSELSDTDPCLMSKVPLTAERHSTLLTPESLHVSSFRHCVSPITFSTSSAFTLHLLESASWSDVSFAIIFTIRMLRSGILRGTK